MTGRRRSNVVRVERDATSTASPASPVLPPVREGLDEERGDARVTLVHRVGPLDRGGLARPAEGGRTVAHVAWWTSRGLVREDNQDAVLLAAAPAAGAGAILVGAFDGVGGESGGGAASRTAARSFASAASEPKGGRVRSASTESLDFARWLRKAMGRAHDDVRARAREDRTRGMTTATALLTDGQEVTVGHVGDSRAYRLRGGVLSQLTVDQTMVEALARRYAADDGLSREEALRKARASGWQHTILEVVGGSEDPTVQAVTAEVCPGDVLLLSTDGLHEFVPERRLVEVLSSGSDAARIARALVEDAYAFHSDDNVSVVVVKFVDALETPQR